MSFDVAGTIAGAMQQTSETLLHRVPEYSEYDPSLGVNVPVGSPDDLYVYGSVSSLTAEERQIEGVAQEGIRALIPALSMGEGREPHVKDRLLRGAQEFVVRRVGERAASSTTYLWELICEGIEKRS